MEGAEFPNDIWSIDDFKEKWLSDVKVPKTYLSAQTEMISKRCRNNGNQVKR
jgi:hypothetical protein